MPIAIKMQKKKIVGKLRRSQLITTFGPGSIVDMPGYSVIMASTKYWKNDSPVLHEKNLEKLLHVSGFKSPYVSETTDSKILPDIPAMRFPTYHFCPKCGRLMPFWAFGGDNDNKCSECGKHLVPSRFVAACINGHLEDFPYSWWVHRGDYSKCPYNKKRDNLEVHFTNETGGLESIVIKCRTCGATRSMAGCMSEDALRGYRCHGYSPWYYRDDPEYKDVQECKAHLRTLQRGASNVYFSIVQSALTIPPSSRRVNQVIDSVWEEKLRSKMEKNPSDDILKAIIDYEFSDSLIDTGLSTVDEILDIIKKKYAHRNDKEKYTRQNLLEDEYRVFCMGDYQRNDDTQFRSERVQVPNDFREYLEDVVLVKRLREVMALQGFRRISPEIPDIKQEKFYGYNRKGEYIPLCDPEPDWLPGIEMLGEGIFIRLKEKAVEQWESVNSEEYKTMGQRLCVSNVNCGNFSPRYVLLHTLSHLLIRQLTLECGYSGAAIKERIYSTYPDSDRKMCGILMYTSTSDSDGSLGGLARQGRPDALNNIFRGMLQNASWCSSDPVCIKSKAQGFDSLNYAACHACTLLPETSCEMRNCLLDRAAIVGELGLSGRGYFETLVRDHMV